MSAAPDISLPCFEGPLDLLLSLVRKNEIEIADLPIADITRQYLDYLHQAAQLDLNLGSEFVYMAAWLIQIKTRCLLAGDSETASNEDPRQELVHQLLDHGQVRQAVDFLKQKLEASEATWSRSEMEVFREPQAEADEPVSNGAFNLLQILRLARHALATAKTHDFVSSSESVTVEEMVDWLGHRIAEVQGCIDAGDLLAEQPDRPHQVALFLAILEMTNTAQIDMQQEQPFGPIILGAFNMAQLCRNGEQVREC